MQLAIRDVEQLINRRRGWLIYTTQAASIYEIKPGVSQIQFIIFHFSVISSERERTEAA